MQNAKDTFYLMLQGRIAALNPARTVVVRGLVRPGVLVEENELNSAAVVPDAFRLDWSALHVDATLPLPLATLQCTIRYTTAGSVGNGGMDRGRALAAMDGELVAALGLTPKTAPKMNYAASVGGTAPVAMATNVFWADPVFGPCEVVGERLSRTTTVQVMAYQEEGEL